MKMLVGDATFCDTLTVYVPVPPRVPEMKAVTIVFAVKLVPLSLTREFMAMTPLAMAETVSVVPEIVPVN